MTTERCVELLENLEELVNELEDPVIDWTSCYGEELLRQTICYLNGIGEIIQDLEDRNIELERLLGAVRDQISRFPFSQFGILDNKIKDALARGEGRTSPPRTCGRTHGGCRARD